MEIKKEALVSEERKCIIGAIYELVRTYPELNGLSVMFEEFGAGSSLAVFSEPGAYVNRRYITGGFEAVVPFSIVYRASPKLAKQKINMIDYLEKLAEWMRKSEYPVIGDGRSLEMIQAETVAAKDMSNSAGDNDYVIIMSAIYRKE